MAAVISRDSLDGLAAKYGWEDDAKASTVAIGHTAYPVTWTKRGHTPPTFAALARHAQHASLRPRLPTQDCR